jgi:hypothetical protein
VLYVSYKRISGKWLAFDLTTDSVLASGQLTGYGVMTSYRDRVYAGANHGDTLYRVGPGLSQAEILYPEIGTTGTPCRDWCRRVTARRRGPRSTATSRWLLSRAGE